MQLLNIPWIPAGILLFIGLFVTVTRITIILQKNIIGCVTNETPKKAWQISKIPFWITLFGLIIIGTLLYSLLLLDANRKGWDHNPKTYLSTMVKTNRLLNRESRIAPEDIKPGDVILYLRYDCGDCHKAWPKLKQELETQKDTDRVFLIYSRSTKGNKLKQKYPVHEVPSGVCIRQDGSVTEYVLHKNGTADLDNLHLLLKLSEKIRGQNLD